jgi:hypothetical protein
MSICPQTKENQVKAWKFTNLKIEEPGKITLVFSRRLLRYPQLTLYTVQIRLWYPEWGDQLFSSKSEVAAGVIGCYASLISPE